MCPRENKNKQQEYGDKSSVVAVIRVKFIASDRGWFINNKFTCTWDHQSSWRAGGPMCEYLCHSSGIIKGEQFKAHPHIIAIY